ncbi:uncharacterized protein METZ01_LOCUS305730, partial [marine metagenome]
VKAVLVTHVPAHQIICVGVMKQKLPSVRAVLQDALPMSGKV